MDNTLVSILIAFVSLVMLFAQLKLFSIDGTLKEVLKVLQDQAKGRSVGPDPSEPSIAREEPEQPGSTSVQGQRPCPHCGTMIFSKARRCDSCWRRVKPLV
jgi:hypothetical protein